VSGLRFSLVVPVFDEQDNVAPLLDETAEVLAAYRPFEMLLVDDASADNTLDNARRWRTERGADWLRILRMARNSGQSAAVLAGVERARAPLVLTMDGDLQNDPRDLPRILELLEAGAWQGVTGIRERRRDSAIRRLSSRIGNAVRNLVTGDRVADAACGIKGFRRELFLAVPRFDGMHRFMATLARQAGGRVCEVPVRHRPRHAGRAKYGIGNRALRGLRDCFAVRWLRDRRLRREVAEIDG
jgi:dolichol-phosphate mannosyltransferase